jgi:polysaccharide export outer membrane protein
MQLRIIALTLLYLLSGLSRPSTAQADDYRVHSGDVLNVQVFGEQTLSQPVTVLNDGSIVYPLVGRLMIGGETLPEVTHQLTTSLNRYIHEPMVTVGVTTQGSLSVLVLGNIKTPGKYALPSDSRLTDAIAAAGGLGPTNGAFPAARISVGTQGPQNVSLEKLLHDGDVALNIPLRNDTVVYIPSPATIRVRIIGAVDKPGEIEIGEGDHLSLAIAKAGTSTNSNADLNHVHITRAQADGKATTSEVNLYRELQQGDLRADPVLQKGDVVYVPQSRRGGGDTGYGVMSVLRRLFIPF